MNETLRDIREKISNNVYVNEEHIRLNIVIRILEKLGWDIWNPQEVNAEFYVSPDEDKTKVDLALFANSYSPSVFIEIKNLGKIFDNLSKIERQLRNYNRDNTAKFSIISDGQIWRFYYSQTGGEFAKKFFKQIDILNDDIEDVELHFLTFLSKEEIQNGNAEREASKYLALSQKQKVMEDAIPKARRLVQEPPFPSLPEALINLVKKSGIDISLEEAIEYINQAQDKLPERQEKKHSNGKNNINEKDYITHYKKNVQDFRFTKILEGRIEKDSSKSWNHLLRLAIKNTLGTGMKLDEIKSLINVNIVSGKYYEQGFYPIPGKNYSMQNIDASNAALKLKKLAQNAGLSLYVKFEWKEKSPFAGEKGVIKINVD